MRETRKFKQPINTKVTAFMAHHSQAELKEMGKALRDKCPRTSHAEWRPPHDRPGPGRTVAGSAHPAGVSGTRHLPRIWDP